MKNLTKVIMTICAVGALILLIFAAAAPVHFTPAEYQTRGQIRAIQSALEEYQSEYGGYPICEDPEEGAKVIYQALYADYDGDGVPDLEEKVFMEKLQPPKLDEDGNPVGQSWVAPAPGGGWQVVDRNGNPIYYLYARPSSFSSGFSGGGKYNLRLFDIWSIGDDPDPNDDNRSMWIKNW